MLRIVAYTLDNAETLGAAFTEQYPVADRQKLGTLDETECHQCSISCANEGAVNVDNGACLTDCSDVKHGLVLGTDSGGMRKNEHCYSISRCDCVLDEE